MYALKHARMGGNPEAIENVQNEVDVMKAIRGHPHVLTLRAVVSQGPTGAEVRREQGHHLRSMPALLLPADHGQALHFVQNAVHIVCMQSMRRRPSGLTAETQVQKSCRWPSRHGTSSDIEPSQGVLFSSRVVRSADRQEPHSSWCPQTEAYLLLDLCTESLVDRLATAHEGRLPEPTALAAFTSVCEAVAIMHAQLPPIAHRQDPLFPSGSAH